MKIQASRRDGLGKRKTMIEGANTGYDSNLSSLLIAPASSTKAPHTGVRASVDSLEGSIFICTIDFTLASNPSRRATDL